MKVRYVPLNTAVPSPARVVDPQIDVREIKFVTNQQCCGVG
jgi:hypothetical protein